MSDDLVKRLRRPTGLNAVTQEPVQDKLNMAAADRIEELEAHCKRLRLEAAHANDTADAAIERTKELEAKLEKVATRLQHIAANKISDELSVVEWDTHDTFSILDGCILSARTTLAELKGGKDET